MIIRPTELIPVLDDLPLYQIAIVPCSIFSWHKLIPQLTWAGLRERPVLVGGIGIAMVALLSSLLNGVLEMGFNWVNELLKMLLFYMLMLAHVDSAARLRAFLRVLVAIVLIPIVLAVLNYHGYLTVAAFKVIVDSGDVRRLAGTGLFSDPNDVCEILNCAMFLCFCGLLDRADGFWRILWLGPMAVFGHALTLTQSRGGLLAAMVGLAVLFRSRLRGKGPKIVGALALVLILIVLRGSRQASLSTSDGTGQSRIQLWDDGFEMLKRSPLVGIGCTQFGTNLGHVAHNAFVQTYTELGFIGGTLLFGQYFWCLRNMTKLGSKDVIVPDPEVRRVHPFVLASLAGFAASEMSVTNPRSLVTYTMFGLATVCIRLADPIPPWPDLVLNRGLIRRIIVYSALFLLALYIFTRVSVRYG